MNLKFNYLGKIVIIIIIIISLVTLVNSSEKILSRKRRFLAFPPGSSFSAALCTTIGSIGNPDVNFLSYALNWGVSYNLPNDTWVIQSSHGFNNPAEPNPGEPNPGEPNPVEPNPGEPNPVEQKKRVRRDLYRKFEVAIDSMGYNGIDCVLRAICESAQYLFNRTGNMIEEIFKMIFSYPGTRKSDDECNYISNNDQHYWNAFQLGRKHKTSGEEHLNDCSYKYQRCSFSLLELALGKHSAKTTKFY